MARTTFKDGRWRKTPPNLPGIRNRQRTDAAGVYWVFEVRWKDPATGKRLSETLDTPQEALDFKAHLRLLARRGALGDVDRGSEQLDDFARRWLNEHARTHLTPKVLVNYTGIYDLHISGPLGQFEIRAIKPKAVDQLRSHMLEDGCGPAIVRKTLTVLSSILTQAVLWELIDANPVHQVRKPSGKRAKVITPLSVMQVERFLHELRALGDHDGAALATLMAYTGARPQDALALTYDDVRDRIHMTHKIVDGERLPGSKTGQHKTRTVEALPSLRRFLLARRALLPGTTAESLIVSEPDGNPWQEHTYKNWYRKAPRGRVRKDGQRAGNPGPFTRAAEAAGLPADTTPYSLRHTWASLRIAEQRLSLKEIADEMGHSVQMLDDNYSHVISEYAGQGPVDPETLIADARATLAGTDLTDLTKREAQ